MLYINDMRKKLGPNLWRLARNWSHGLPGSQKNRESAIAALKRPSIDGSKSKKTAREAVEATAKAISAERAKRMDKKGYYFCKKRESWVSVNEGDSPYKSPIVHAIFSGATLEERLEMLIARNVRELLTCRYRFDAYPKIKIIGAAADLHLTIWIAQERYKDWDFYKSKWVKECVNTTISVPRDWRTSVLAHGIACPNSLVTLRAKFVGSERAIKVYQAVWVHQSLGYNLEVRRGYIGKCGPYFCHSDSYASALSGVKRKISKVTA